MFGFLDNCLYFLPLCLLPLCDKNDGIILTFNWKDIYYLGCTHEIDDHGERYGFHTSSVYTYIMYFQVLVVQEIIMNISVPNLCRVCICNSVFIIYHFDYHIEKGIANRLSELYKGNQNLVITYLWFQTLS